MNIEDPRAQTQVIAALKFWAAVAGQSQTHPSRHKDVAPVFNHYLPMTTREIEQFLESMEAPKAELVTLNQMAKEARLHPRTLRRRVAKVGVKPVACEGRTRFYRRHEIRPIVGRILGSVFRGPTCGRPPKLHGSGPGVHGGRGSDQHERGEG